MIDPTGLCLWYNLYCEAVQPAAHFVWHHRGAFAAGLGAVALGVATGGFGFAVDAGSALATDIGIGTGAAASALTAAGGGYEIANGQYLAGSVDLFLGALGGAGTGFDIASSALTGASSDLADALGKFIDVSGGDAGLLACLVGL